MKLFNVKYVHFMWDAQLLGNSCIFSDSIEELIAKVNEGDTSKMQRLRQHVFGDYPFNDGNNNWKFCYYDKHYAIKVAFNKGETVQYLYASDSWMDITVKQPEWNENVEYRVRPSDSKFKLGARVKLPDDSVGIITGYNASTNKYFVAGAVWTADEMELMEVE